ncbi:hypothetical protein GGI35DRAFT_481808 [Trichoderma velutinum]
MDYDDLYERPSISVVYQEDPWNQHLRQINIDLGASVSAEAESGREILILIKEPVEGDDFVAVPWQLLEGWFYRLDDVYIISLLVQDREEFDADGEFYNEGPSACFLFTVHPLRITLLD